MSPDASSRLQGRVGVVAVSAAIAVPALLTGPSPPTASFQTNTAAFLGWGLWLAWIGYTTSRTVPAKPSPATAPPGEWAAILAVVLLAAAAVASSLFAGLPARLLWPSLAALAASALALWGGLRTASLALRCSLASGRCPPDPVGLFLWAVVLTGAVNAVLACAQYAGAADWWPGLMPPGKDGRPGGHLRHPSLLGTWLVWSVCALAALRAMHRSSPAACCGLGTVLVAGIILSGSRTAALCCLLLPAWGVIDRQLDRRARVALVLTPVAVLLGWWLLLWWGQAGGQAFGGAQVIQKADLTSSRGRLWQQAWRLIQDAPLFGVGFGQFNFAWTLTPMDGLPRAGGHPFTHAHNLFVHWAVELGVPIALALTGLLGFSLVAAFRGRFIASAQTSPVGRAAFVMVLVVVLHSQLEFPLWYMHFLLPTAFLLGLALTDPSRGPEVGSSATGRSGRSTRWHATVLCGLGCTMALAGTLAMQQYRAIADVYQPANDSPDDDTRIALAQRSWLYGHLADRLRGTLAPQGQRTLDPFREVVFEMLDPSLLAAWAAALDEHCDSGRATHLRARMREFGWSVPAASPEPSRGPLGPSPSPSKGPCEPAQMVRDYRDFR
jgi:O-antigen ligase